MIAADRPIPRSVPAKLMIVDANRRIRHVPRSTFVDALRSGDLVIANDAATLPASLLGEHVATGTPLEVRLAGRRSLAVDDVKEFSAILFGEGTYRTRTEDRPLPPRVALGDQLAFSSLRATMVRELGHPRLVSLLFAGSADAIWAGLARHGRPIQYAHVTAPLALWDVWTPIAGLPVAFEAPSAGFILDWRSVAAMRDRGIAFATITHAAGISSTGDEALDRRLPFDEPYRIPQSTAQSIRRTRARGGRIVAIGTTVVRALEHAASRDGEVRAGDGLATQRIDANTHLNVVDAIVSGTHEPATSHYQLLRAFTDDATLERADRELDQHNYRTHEFGDSVLIEKCVSTEVFPLVRERSDALAGRDPLSKAEAGRFGAFRPGAAETLR